MRCRSFQRFFKFKDYAMTFGDKLAIKPPKHSTRAVPGEASLFNHNLCNSIERFVAPERFFRDTKLAAVNVPRPLKINFPPLHNYY